jgi:hypothetical protein
MGRWVEADGYLQDFVPNPKDWSDECLRLMVHVHHALTLAAGGSEAGDYATRFDDEDVLRNPHYASEVPETPPQNARRSTQVIYRSCPSSSFFSLLYIFMSVSHYSATILKMQGLYALEEDRTGCGEYNHALS